jgi:hypothetical protein
MSQASGQATTIQPLSAVSAPDWDALFERKSGWTGADGIYSIPLSGDERPGSAAHTTTFFTFNDTFIGSVDSNNRRIGKTAFLRNTSALLKGWQPSPNQIRFYQNVVTPNTSRLWLWPNDGIAQFGNIYVFSLRMKSTATPGPYNFDYDGISLLIGKAQGEPIFHSQIDAPLYQSARKGTGSVIFGQAVMPNTKRAGAPQPDGYVYIYGIRNDIGDKKLLVARVLSSDLTQFTQYQFWDGSNWSPSISRAAPVEQINNHLSSEFSVTPLPDGRFLLVFKPNDVLGKTIAVRYGKTPHGPWGADIPIWTPPEAKISANIFTYGAKAHPHLSQPGQLLISYHVNSTFRENFSNAGIYRPRFIRVPLP